MRIVDLNSVCDKQTLVVILDMYIMRFGLLCLTPQLSFVDFIPHGVKLHVSYTYRLFLPELSRVRMSGAGVVLSANTARVI